MLVDHPDGQVRREPCPPVGGLGRRIVVAALVSAALTLVVVLFFGASAAGAETPPPPSLGTALDDAVRSVTTPVVDALAPLTEPLAGEAAEGVTAVSPVAPSPQVSPDADPASSAANAAARNTAGGAPTRSM